MRKLLTILLLSISSIALAQEMSVKSFYLAETDLTANTPGTLVHDQNGTVCALIKVETSLDGFTFDVGSLGVREVKRVAGEIWVYVPFGIRKLTISHPQLGVIRDYALNVQIEKGRTYILKLNATLGNRAYDSSKKQKMILQVVPTNAKLEINGMPMSLDKNGIYEQEVSFGIYDVEISASRYHSERRQIHINDISKPQQFTFHLKQAYGWLQVSGSGDEKMFIDGNPVTFLPNKRIEMMSGHYKVLLQKPLHKPYERVIEIKDSVVCEIEPSYDVNYRELEFKVDNNAEIWVDDVKVATGSWIGKLEYGTHTIECRKVCHRTSVFTLNVEPQTVGPILLDSPKPIYGSLLVTSNPTGAKLYVNNEYYGITPKYIPHQIIGDYSIYIETNSKKSKTEVIKIDEGLCSSLDFDMNLDKTTSKKEFSGLIANEKQLVQLILKPTDAILEIEGERKATRNGVYEELLPFGRYSYKVYHSEYHESKGSFSVYETSSRYSESIELKPAFGYLSVTNDAQKEISGAKVFVDREYFGTIPFVDKHLPSGIHSITVTKDKYITYTNNISISDGEKIVLTPNLTPICGSLSVSTKPINARLYLDNVYVGHTNKEIKELIIGEHTIKVSLDEYYTEQQNVIIKENQNTSVSLSLRRRPISDKENDRRYRNYGVVNSVDFNYGFPINSSKVVYKNLGVRDFKCLHPIEFTYNIGYRFNNWVSVSLGTGITHELVDLRNKGDKFADYYYVNNVKEIVNYSPNIVPIYANSKFYLSRRKYQPMISISNGMYVVPKVKVLFMCDFGIGVNYRLNRILSCYTMLSVGTAPSLKGTVDVYSNMITATRSMAWTPRIKVGITL